MPLILLKNLVCEKKQYIAKAQNGTKALINPKLKSTALSPCQIARNTPKTTRQTDSMIIAF